MLPMIWTGNLVSRQVNETPVPWGRSSGCFSDFHFFAGRPPDHIVITNTLFMAASFSAGKDRRFPLYYKPMFSSNSFKKASTVCRSFGLIDVN